MGALLAIYLINVMLGDDTCHVMDGFVWICWLQLFDDCIAGHYVLKLAWDDG